MSKRPIPTTLRACTFAALLMLAAMASVHAQPLFRISVENTDDHVQTRAVARFAEALAARTEGQLRVEFFSNARLFRDRDVVPALADGKVEMAVPGTWQLDRFEPSVGVLLLPAFYGRDRAFLYERFAGPLGDELDRRIERATGTVVAGRWIDLGPIHLFTVDAPIRSHDDIAGLRIRYAGGVVNEMRLAALGADPQLIPWPELPQRLEQGDVAGVLTSFETVASASLWERGIKHAFADAQYFGRYVPLVSRTFWNRISPELREVISDTWNEFADLAREEAARAQDRARDVLAEHGVSIVVPDPAELDRARSRLMAQQDEMIGQLGLDPAVVDLLPDS